MEDVVSGAETAPGEPGCDGSTTLHTAVERLIDIEVSEEYGTVTEEIELICTMTGFRRRFLVHHIGEGFFRSVELGPS
jgi:hypothetical protein